jgi:hypothetical protein
MSEQQKTFDVGEWFKEKFAGYEVLDNFDATRLSQFYHFRHGTAIRHRVWVHEDFLADHNIEEILARLDEWHVDQRIRQAGLRAVTVTSQGVQIAPD